MKFSAVSLLFAVLVDPAHGAPINSCSTQFGCIDFTVTPTSGDIECDTEDCQYKICLTLNLNKDGCVKSSTDTVSHTCLKDEDQCTESPFSGATETPNVANGDEQCQIVPGGGVARFLLKDGGGCDKDTVPNTSNSLRVTCQWKDDIVSDGTSCTGNENEKECIWSVQAPACPTPSPMTGTPTSPPVSTPTDPPVTATPSKQPTQKPVTSAPTSTSTSPPVSEPTDPPVTATPSKQPTQKPAPVSVPPSPKPVTGSPTKLPSMSPPVTSTPSTSPKITPPPTDPPCEDGCGPGGDPHIKKWNGKTYSYHGACDLVIAMSKYFGMGLGFDLHIRTTIRDFYSYIESAALRIGTSVLEVSTQDKFMINGTEFHDEDLPLDFSGYTLGRAFKLGTSTAYALNLKNGGFIHFRLYNRFMSVRIQGMFQDYEDVVGLMGNYTHGAQYARDGKTILDDSDAFGAEWQVRPDQDPILFQKARVPQWPQTCNMPLATQRHLRSDPSFVKRAEEVCAHKSPEDFDFCVEDVLATKDEGMAGAW